MWNRKLEHCSNTFLNKSNSNDTAPPEAEPNVVKKDVEKAYYDQKVTQTNNNYLAILSLVASDAVGVDHGLAKKDQFGPCRSSRALAMVHLAMMEVAALLNGEKQYKTYYNDYSKEELDAAKEFYYFSPSSFSKQINDYHLLIAVTQAWKETMESLYPQQKNMIQFISDKENNDSLIKSFYLKVEKARKFGSMVAKKVLEDRKDDGSNDVDQKWDGFNEDVNNKKYTLSQPDGKAAPGEWIKDPITNSPMVLGTLWGSVKPFALKKPIKEYRIPPFHAFDSEEFKKELVQVMNVGGDGSTAASKTIRTADQTDIGIYWGYDGAPSVGCPPSMSNEIVHSIILNSSTAEVTEESTPNLDFVEHLRHLALLHIANADATIACWDSKYHYKIERPVTAIRNPNPVRQIEGWTPMGAPASNTTKPNFTPPFPAYPSGHSVLGGVLFQMLRNIYRTDNYPFTFISTEMNGKTKDNKGNVRPLKPRSFKTFTEAELENSDSRIYLGIHWKKDGVTGVALGNTIADEIFENVFPIANQI